MHHQGHETTEVGYDHFRSTGVKLWATVHEERSVREGENKKAGGEEKKQ